MYFLLSVTVVLQLAASKPPTFKPASPNLTPLPIITESGEWARTSVIFDGPTTTTPADMGLSAFSGGIRMSKPGPVNRLYLVNEAGTAYQQFHVNNRALEFTVDVSQVKCGYNAAFYFSQMNAQAPIGTQYCDGQGTCSEFDMLESNIAAINEATHGCQGSNCDHWGCALNSRRSLPSPSDISPGAGAKIDLTKPFTVKNTFKTSDGTDNGELIAIEQVYTQGGRTYSMPTITDNYCLALGAADPQFPTTGQLGSLSNAFKSGMTLIFSLWGSGDNNMNWLDGGLSNPYCKAPANGDNSAKFSNIKISRI